MSRFVLVCFAALVGAIGVHPTAAVAKLSPIARIHGKIVQINPARGTFLIHHEPFAAMPMAMTMEVEPKHRADLRKLHVGTRIVPWPGTDIRPAPGGRAGAR
jgi:Cu/Ag efflux protein CusF